MRSTFVERAVVRGWGLIKPHLPDWASQPLRTTLAAVLVLTAVHILFFWPHYLGRAIFPWDFCFAYHYFAYAWVHDGGLFSPPVWMPYGSLGYPAHLIIQNSSFYLPVEIVGWLGLPYSLHAATLVQCLHILAGGIGCFVFLRTCGLSPLVSLTGGVGFLLSGGFFYNGQHVDIIRGYALTPWLFAAYSPVFLRRPAAVAGTAAITALFAMGAYPGIIIATVYCFGLYLAWCLAVRVLSKDRPRYVGFVVLAAMLAGMLVTVKYLPLALQLDELGFEEKAANFGTPPISYLTAFFRFDLQKMPGDISMQCLYVPSLILISMLFLRRMTAFWVVGAATVLLTILLTTEGSLIRILMMHVPGFTISRFPLFDYRGLMHLGFVVMGAVSLQQLSDCRIRFLAAVFRGFTALLVLVLSAFLAGEIGYSVPEMAGEFSWFIVGTLALVLVSRWLASQHTAVRIVTHAVLWVIMVLGTFTYVNHMPLTWKYLDYQSDLERIVYQRPVSKVFEARRRVSKWPCRPPRYMDGYGTPAPDLGMGYYYQMFGVGGDDKGVRLVRTAAFKQAMKADASGTLLQFMSSESQRILSAALPASTNEIDQATVAPPSEAHVSMVEYGLSHAVYDVDLPQDMWMTENEIFFPGWRSELRDGDTVRNGPMAEAAFQCLRAWHLPAGHYQLVTEYIPPGWHLALVLTLVGASCCAGLVIFDVVVGSHRERGQVR